MRKPMSQESHDWSTFAARGDTESVVRCAVPVIIVDDSPADEEADTLRMIEVALEWVERERPSAPDIETCTDSSRRSSYPVR